MTTLTSRLRATRASPPGRALDDTARRAIFAAAVQQSEELFAAASAIGPYGRPIPLYYAISQAGRAAVAAWSDDPVPPPLHGLTQDRSQSNWQARDIRHFRIKPQRNKGEFDAVASTLGLPGLTGSVELGELWSALPGELPVDDNWALALPVWPEVYAQAGGVSLHFGAAHRGFVHLRGQAPDTDLAAIRKLLERYPDATGAEIEMPQGVTQQYPTPWGPGLSIKWPSPSITHSGVGPPPPELVESYVINRVPAYRYRREHWLIPVVGQGRDLMRPLLLWWVFIFGLSLLARYEPAAWRAALDPDQSEIAVPLEQVLDTALQVVPDLLHEAITHERTLLPPRR